MHDFKNILLAWISSASTIFAAFVDGDTLYVISAIILPIVFFTLGKTIDVLVQLYLDGRRASGRSRAVTPGAANLQDSSRVFTRSSNTRDNSRVSARKENPK